MIRYCVNLIQTGILGWVLELLVLEASEEEGKSFCLVIVGFLFVSF